MALTDIQIKNLKYPGKPMKIADGGGLYLYLSESGKKLWRMSYYFERRQRILSFGEYPVVTLQRAREKRMEAKQLLAEGIDPAAVKKAAKEEQIFSGATRIKEYRSGVVRGSDNRLHRKTPGHGSVSPGEIYFPGHRQGAYRPHGGAGYPEGSPAHRT